MKTIIVIAILLTLVIIQFFSPERNISNEHTNDIASSYFLPDSVASILQVACNDCHSNRTEYPWYSGIQPVAWWLDHHIKDGKRHLNFSTFTTRPIAVQYHKLEEIVETVEEGEMPLPSYSWLGLHPDAKLTAEQRALVISWARDNLHVLKSKYPADSLIMRKR